MREREREATEEILDSLEYYEVTKEIAKKAGQYKRVYREKGVTLSLPDVVIAAIAISHNLTLVTDNLRHYPMPEIRIRQIETRSRG
jgi:predicted nucleic acid-binding protein